MRQGASYQVMVKAWNGRGFKWAIPWTFGTWAEAKQCAANVRASANYEAVKVRKVAPEPQGAA